MKDKTEGRERGRKVERQDWKDDSGLTEEKEKPHTGMGARI